MQKELITRVIISVILLITFATVSPAKNGPDVMIEEIHIMPELWDYGGEPYGTVCTFWVKMKNIGNRASPEVLDFSDELNQGVRIEITSGGEPDLITYYLPALNPGQTTTKIYYADVTGEGETLEPGYFDDNSPLIVKLDPNNTFAEANKLNNQAQYHATFAHPVMMGIGATATAVYNIDSVLLNIDVFYEERLSEPIATGTATFNDNGVPIPGCENVILGTFPEKASNGGSAYCTFSSTVLGVHNLTASYSGDGYYDPMNSETLAVTVHEYPPTPASDQVFTVSEVVSDNTLLGTVLVDGPAATGFSIIGGNVDNAFSIDNSGAIRVNDNSVIDYETLSSYTLLIETTDGSLTGSGEVTVNVTDVTHTVTAILGPNGTLDAGTPSPQTREEGETAQFTFHADSNYHVATITGCGIAYTNSANDVGSRTETTEALTGDCTINASFAINAFNLAYTAGENGTLAGSAIQLVDYGDDGTQLTAVPDSGYAFVNWSDGLTANPRTDTNIQADLSVTANFARDHDNDGLPDDSDPDDDNDGIADDQDAYPFDPDRYSDFRWWSFWPTILKAAQDNMPQE